MADKQSESSTSKQVDQVKDEGSAPSAAPRTTGVRIEDLFKLLSTSQIPQPSQTKKSMDEHKFWKTQPVRAFDQEVDKEGPIDFSKTIDEVPKTPQKLPDEFEWSTVDVTDSEQLDEVYDLLHHNYIEDDDATFRFKYSPAFLNWALKPPGWNAEWNVGVRVKTTKKLIGFIAGIPGKLRVRANDPIDITEINFLCVHKKLRSKRLAPVLIREVTRRVNLTGIWQALYTAGIVLPSPVSTCRYYHRSINWPKLYDVGFSPLPYGSTAAKQVARFALPVEPTLPNLRPMEKKDVAQVTELLNAYLGRFDIAPIFNEEEVVHWFLNIQSTSKHENVVYSYVTADESSKITDFISFYGLESTVLGNPNHNSINVGYAFYYATSVALDFNLDSKQRDAKLKTRLTTLFQNALIFAKKFNFDVFNALTLLDNNLFLDDLKFGPGDGFLNYYLFNYKAFPIHGGINPESSNLERKSAGGVGVVML
jgi:glycylpeptide N-tetradecanoyltransferase